MLRALRIPVGWTELFERARLDEVMADNCLGLAAQLAYYFFLALFPALLFLVAHRQLHSVAGLMDTITQTLARVAPGEVHRRSSRIRFSKIAHDKNGGLLTIGMLGTIWSTSSGVNADHRHAEPGVRHPGRTALVEGAGCWRSA